MPGPALANTRPPVTRGYTHTLLMADIYNVPASISTFPPGQCYAILTFSRHRANSCGPKWWLEPKVSRLSPAPPRSHTPNLFRHLSVWTRHPQRQSWDVEVLRMTILGCNCAGFVDTTCCCHQWPRLFRCLLCISAKLVHHPNIKFKPILNLICNCFYRHTCILHNVIKKIR